MEMPSGTSVGLTFLSFVYLCSLNCPTATAKCRGRWAIHACYGGNGKRSDPALSATSQRSQPTLLQKVLLSNLKRLDNLLQESRESEEMLEEDFPSQGFELEPSEMEDSPTLMLSQPSSDSHDRYRRLRGYLLAFKLKRAIRADQDTL